jgi:phosphatidylserine/phosphatidylglycerophosphate/cardiolipin synthase-like enzyme
MLDLSRRKRGQLDLVFGIGFIVLVSCALFAADKKPAEPQLAVQVWFSPKGGCTEAIVKTIREAKKTILVLAYSFTSDPIRDALVAACERGVEVSLVQDRRSYRSAPQDADAVKAAGGDVRADGHHAIMHNKIMVIDSKIVLTGSFNWSAAAEESNAENLLRLDVLPLAKRYSENFKLHFDHADKIANRVE